MAKPEEIGSDKSSSLTDGQVRRFLLGRLTESERARFEERLLADDDLVERTRLAEFELSDEYAADRLDAVDREAFAKKFLVSEDRRDKLRVSRALHKHVAVVSPEAIREKKSWLQGVLALFNFERSPVFATAGSLAILILIAGAVWFVVRQTRPEQQTVASHETVPSSAPVNVNTSNQVPNQPAPSPQTFPDRKPATLPSPPEPQTPPTIATFTLLPGSLRGSGDLRRVVVPGGKQDVVRLVLVPEADGLGTYRAELLTDDGKTVLVRDRLQVVNNNAGPSLVLNIPAHLLKVGDYQIKLGRQLDGKTEVIGSYYFRSLQK